MRIPRKLKKWIKKSFVRRTFWSRSIVKSIRLSCKHDFYDGFIIKEEGLRYPCYTSKKRRLHDMSVVFD